MFALTTIVTLATLPNVLIIGDSISQGYRPHVRDRLDGVANVYYIPVNAEHTAHSLDHLDIWTAQAGQWDVITCNWGLHDVRFCPDDCRTSPAQYESNLRELLDRLLSVNGQGNPQPTVIISTSTPAPDDIKPSVAVRDVDIAAYNAILRAVAEEYRANDQPVVISDLYTFTKPHLEEWQLDRDIHYNATGKGAQGARMAALVEANLFHPVQLPVSSTAGLIIVFVMVAWAAIILFGRVP